VRSAADYFCDLPELSIAPDMLTLAEHILDRKAAEFDYRTLNLPQKGSASPWGRPELF
jgi:non-homologous end joining protein Ku